jgi:hypothetical protein
MTKLAAVVVALAILIAAPAAEARTGHRTAHMHRHTITTPVTGGERAATWPPIITPGGPRGGAGAPGGPPPVPLPVCSTYPGCAILIG